MCVKLLIPGWRRRSMIRASVAKHMALKVALAIDAGTCPHPSSTEAGLCLSKGFFGSDGRLAVRRPVKGRVAGSTLIGEARVIKLRHLIRLVKKQGMAPRLSDFLSALVWPAILNLALCCASHCQGTYGGNGRHKFLGDCSLSAGPFSRSGTMLLLFLSMRGTQS